MRVKYESSFLEELERIDSKIMIDDYTINGGTEMKKPVIVYEEDSRILHVCIESGITSCNSLEFYYGGGSKKAFTLSDSGNISLDPWITIFELTFPHDPKATIGCNNLDADLKFLETPGGKLGKSLYSDIEVSDEELVWKGTLKKYVVDRGQTEDKDYSVELMDTKRGTLEPKPIRFKSYQSLVIDPGSWKEETIVTSKTVREDVYSSISSSNFTYWDSPMVDSIATDTTPVCIENFDKYLNPGDIVFGNDDCFQYIKYTRNSQLVFRGFRVYGTSGSKVEALFNQSYSGGPFVIFPLTIDETGYGNIEVGDLEFYHFNGLRASGPCKISRLETIIYQDNIIDVVSPNPDKTYLARVGKDAGEIRVLGECRYKEYESYLGKVREIGSGVDSIESIPSIYIEMTDNTGVDSTVDSQCKKIIYNNSNLKKTNYITATYKIQIQNNPIVKANGNVIFENLEADYKIKIVQDSIVWQNITSPDYIDYSDESNPRNLYVLGYKSGATRTIRILTNIEDEFSPSLFRIINDDPNNPDIISVTYQESGRVIYENEEWQYVDILLETTSENETRSWRPSRNDNPYLIHFTYSEVELGTLSFYAVQKMKIEPELEIWGETFPGQFTKLGEGELTLYNSLTKNFIVVKRVHEINGTENQIWYYRDLSNLNKFFISDTSNITTISGSIYYLTDAEEDAKPEREKGIIRLTEIARKRFVRVINVISSDYSGSLGVLTITESAARPSSWKSLINSNTINIEVFRELSDIYIKVGTSEDDALDKDYTLEVDRIGVYFLTIVTNFKYTINVNESGYLRLINGSTLYEYESVMSDYTGSRELKLALIKLDTGSGLVDSGVIIRSGNITRTINISLGDVITTHSYNNSERPDRARYINRNTTVVTGQVFKYKSSTTPGITYSGMTGTVPESVAKFEGDAYKEHQTTLGFSVPNPIILSRTKYPMKSFGSVLENSLSYSDPEENTLEYFYYMKGLEHDLWYSDSLLDFSDINNQGKKIPVVLDASEGSGKTAYVVSRYSPDNKTFRSEYPTIDTVKLRNGLEFKFDVQDWAKLSSADPVTQIEYYLPIKVTSTYPNTGGNIYLGSLKFKAITKITDGSITDVIEADEELLEYEITSVGDTYSGYITNKIGLSDSTTNLELQIFQAGSDGNAFGIVSKLDSEFTVDGDTQYIIPEIGSDRQVSSLSVSSSVTNCDVTEEDIDSSLGNFVVVEVRVKNRLPSGNKWYTNPSTISEASDYNNTVTISMNSQNFVTSFKQYGYHKALVMKDLSNSNVYCGIGHNESITNPLIFNIPAGGGVKRLRAGIADITSGISSSEFLAKPSKFYFIGEEPLSYDWEDGNLNDSGNFLATFRTRGVNEEGNHDYTMVVEYENEYYPLKVYVIFRQSASQSSYVLDFDSSKIGVYSDGSIASGTDNGRIYFTSNLNEELFRNVYFVLGSSYNSHDLPTIPDDMNIITVEERNFKEGYIKVKFRPNGSRTYITTKLWAVLNNYGPVGSISVEMGYSCMIAKLCYYSGGASPGDPYTSSSGIRENYLSRQTPTLCYDTRGSFTITRMGTPCKAENDNGGARVSGNYSLNHRQVLKLIWYYREYGDSSESSPSFSSSNINVKAELLSFSFENTAFEEVGIAFVPESSGSDYDAMGIAERTHMAYNAFNPYVEFTYVSKEEYYRNSINIDARGKLIVSSNNSDIKSEFYFRRYLIKTYSNEPPDSSIFNVNTTNITLSQQRGSTGMITYSPVSYSDYVSSSIEDGVTWVSISESGSGYVKFVSNSNALVTRRTYANINFIDPRSGVSDADKKYVVYIVQEGKIEFSTNEVWLDYTSGSTQVVSFTPLGSVYMTFAASGFSVDSDLPNGKIYIKSTSENDTNDVISGYLNITLDDGTVKESWCVNIHQRHQE